jgi:hypothetical protein
LEWGILSGVVPGIEEPLLTTTLFHRVYDGIESQSTVVIAAPVGAHQGAVFFLEQYFFTLLALFHFSVLTKDRLVPSGSRALRFL